MRDYHVHTSYSADCEVPLDDMVKQAYKRGIRTLALTDHIDFDLHEEGKFLYEERRHAIEKNRIQYPDMKILCGVEIGIDIHDFDRVEQYLEEHPFDFKIMSLHSVRGHELFEGAVLRKYSPEDMLKYYIEELAIAVTGFKSYDVLGHFDYLRRYSEEIAALDIRKMPFIYDAVLKQVIKDGKGIEINTSANYYGDGLCYPVEALIHRYSELGGVYATIGSDSHRTRTLGINFEEADKLMQRYGLRWRE